MAFRLYDSLVSGDVAKFHAPEAEPWDPRDACAFLRKLADEMESHQRTEYPDRMPF